MQWVQKPKMIRLGEEGELNDLSGTFLQLLNEHDATVDFDLEQQQSGLNILLKIENYSPIKRTFPNYPSIKT